MTVKCRSIYFGKKMYLCWEMRSPGYKINSMQMQLVVMWLNCRLPFAVCSCPLHLAYISMYLQKYLKCNAFFHSTVALESRMTVYNYEKKIDGSTETLVQDFSYSNIEMIYSFFHDFSICTSYVQKKDSLRNLYTSFFLQSGYTLWCTEVMWCWPN